MRILLITLQVLLLILLAPLLGGLITRFKNLLRWRRGPSLVQPYYKLDKLFAKGEVQSVTASWIYETAPLVVFASTVAAAAIIPVLAGDLSFGSPADIFLLIFILALGRFFLALAGLDTGSAFGGMGSSREMFISSLAEPVVLLSLLSVSLTYGSSSAAQITGNWHPRLSAFLSAGAMFMAVIAETSRIPIDNQETHLELTMIHEAMVLEYSGKKLALIELAAYLKQIMFFTLIANLLLPFGFAPRLELFSTMNLLVYLAKLVLLGAVMAVLEISVAKMRLFRAIEFFSFAAIIGFVAVIVSFMGY